VIPPLALPNRNNPLLEPDPDPSPD
jgi:hypothetical protein